MQTYVSYLFFTKLKQFFFSLHIKYMKKIYEYVVETFVLCLFDHFLKYNFDGNNITHQVQTLYLG